MTMHLRLRSATRSASALCFAAGALVATGHVQAEDCKALPNPVYLSGSTAAKLLVGAVGGELAKQDPPVTVVFADSPNGSCVGVNQVISATALTGTASVFSLDDAGKLVTTQCTLTDGEVTDIGVSDIWASSCPNDVSVPSTIKDTMGPVQTMTFVVPAQSSQNSISAQAAYLVFGFGDDSEVSPWNDETQIYVRNENSGTQQMIARTIKVPAAKFQGVSKTGTGANNGSGDVVTGVAAANMDKGIGILAEDALNADARTKLKILAYQHYGQTDAYWPDSDGNSFDKLNVRDGHYPIWGPVHMLAKGDASANVKKVIDLLSGAVETSVDLIALEAKNSVVPQCAMHVMRSEDGGALSCVVPEKDCTCKFVAAATGTDPDGCATCTQDSDCDAAKPACNYGYCEVK